MSSEIPTRACAERAARRFAEAVEALDRGGCVEEATAELTPCLADGLGAGETAEVVRAALAHLAADPPRGNREAAVRMAHAALRRLPPDERPGAGRTSRAADAARDGD